MEVGPHLQRVECVPNFSEGIDREKVTAIVRAMRVPGVALLNWSMDPDHNRSVVTIAGPPDAVVEAAIRAAGRAAELIDLTAQQGVHPRIGAADVIPFIPVAGITLAECALLAHRAGHSIWQRHAIPVYFYEAAATRPDRARLEQVRRGQFEGLREQVLHDAARRPDVGGPALHPTAGASAVGARNFLIAYNLYLDRPDLSVACAIARTVRTSNGGLPAVKAMGVMVAGRAQVSLNLTDFRVTSPGQALAAIRRAAAAHATNVVEAELIGLLPEQAYERDSEWMRLIHSFRPEERILERRWQDPLPWPDDRAGSAEDTN